MVDRDPVTEPAGDMAAAQKLVEILMWIDQGGEDLFYPLAEVMLGWKGKRLRDAIADTGVVHLGKRQMDIGPESDPSILSRLARSAGLVLSGPPLEQFIRSWLEMMPEDSDFRHMRLRALGGLLHIIVRRRERNLAGVSLLLLSSRDELPAKEIPNAAWSRDGARRVDTDGYLAEHLYRQHGRQDPALGETLRAWFCSHGDYINPSKHRVLREAALRGHWDILEAFFESGHPYGEKPKRMLPAGAHTGDLRTKISDYLVDRLTKEDTNALNAVTSIASKHIEEDTGDTEAMLEWLLALTSNHISNELNDKILEQIKSLHHKVRMLRDHDQDNIRDAAATLCDLLDPL